MGALAQRLAKQLFGRPGVAQRRKQEVNGGTGGVGGRIQVTSTTLDSNVSLVHAPGLVGRLKVLPHPLL
jgi:hypothetical protein